MSAQPLYSSGTVLPGALLQGTAPVRPDPLISTMLAREVAKEEDPVKLRQGTVSAMDLVWGPTATPSLTINLGGKDIPGCRFINGYQPRLGDVVWCLRNGLDVLVIGSLAREGVSPFDGPELCSYGSGFTYASNATNDPPRAYAQGDNAYISGRVRRSSGTGIIPFVVPVGYRPRTEIYRAYLTVFALGAGSAEGPTFTAEVDLNGEVTLRHTTTVTWGTTTWLSIFGSYPRERV